MEKKNTSLQQKKLPFRVKLLLDSTDVDLVQIGVNIMKDYIPKKKWEEVLQMFSIDPSYDELYIPKWTWKIEGDDIKITKNVTFIDLWATRKMTQMPLYQLTNLNSTITMTDSDKFTFQLPINAGDNK